MTDARALLDAYAEEVVDIESDFGVFEPIKRADAAEAMLAALRSVLDLHRDRPAWDGTRNVPSGTCTECSEREDTYDDVPWPCATVRAITTALEASA